MADFFATHFAFLTSPEGWAALITLVAMEVVLGIDNLIFISILTNKLPAEHRVRARRSASRRRWSCGSCCSRPSPSSSGSPSRSSPRSATASPGAT